MYAFEIYVLKYDWLQNFSNENLKSSINLILFNVVDLLLYFKNDKSNFVSLCKCMVKLLTFFGNCSIHHFENI